MAQMGVAAFEQTKQDTPETDDARVEAYVQCVASAVAKEADPSVSWEVRVFESPQANAFALPGGKIGVYTGILEVAENQDPCSAGWSAASTRHLPAWCRRSFPNNRRAHTDLQTDCVGT